MLSSWNSHTQNKNQVEFAYRFIGTNEFISHPTYLFISSLNGILNVASPRDT